MQQLLLGSGITLLYILSAAGIMFTVRKLTSIPDELFRKILHFILLGAYIPLVFAFEKWWMATVFSIGMIVLCFPALYFAEKIPKFSSFVNERKKGEYKNSMILAIGMMALSTTICWGLFRDKYLVLASIYAWGVGDGLAALVGKRFGKHKITWKLADGKKSVEGSLAMFICSFTSVLGVLLIRGGLGLPLCFITALLTGAACTVAELCSKNGYDTVICPTVAMVVIIPMVALFGG